MRVRVTGSLVVFEAVSTNWTVTGPANVKVFTPVSTCSRCSGTFGAFGSSSALEAQPARRRTVARNAYVLFMITSGVAGRESGVGASANRNHLFAIINRQSL